MAEVAVETEAAVEVEMEVEMVVEVVPAEEITGINLAGIGVTAGGANMVLTVGSVISPNTRTMDSTPALERQFHEMEAM